MSRTKLSKAEKQELHLEGQRYVNQRATALAAFQYLYQKPFEENGLEALTEIEAQRFVYKIHEGNLLGENVPRKLRTAIRTALTSKGNNIPSRVKNLDEAVSSYANWINSGVAHERYGLVVRLTPDFEDYANALESAGAWKKDQRPSEDEAARDSTEYQVLQEWATDFQSRADEFVITDGLGHIRAISGMIGAFYSDDKSKTIATRKFCQSLFETFYNKPHPIVEKNDPSMIIAVEQIILDPKKVATTLREALEYLPFCHMLETKEDLATLDELPRSGMSSTEQLEYVAPKLLRQKEGKEKPAERTKPTKTFLELTKSIGLEERVDLLDVVDRAISEQGVNPLDLYAKLKRTGLSPLEYAEFLIAGDQFGWRPESGRLVSRFVASGIHTSVDPVTTYLMVARTNFNILGALEEITSNRSGVPAAKELVSNPSLLFIDENAMDLVTLARDYKHGRLIVERYATVKARGLDERAKAVLHVGKLRPNLTDLTYIRDRMRKLPEEEVRFISGCDTIPGIMHLLKKQPEIKTQMPTHKESTSWFDLMTKSMSARGASPEDIKSAESAHQILSDNGGNPRFLRNMFRTQQGDLGQLCADVISHAGNDTFTTLMQREGLFQRYKLGLTQPGFKEDFRGFLAGDYHNPFQALQDYLPIMSSVQEPATTEQPITEQPVEPIRTINDFPGRVFICGGNFKPDSKKRIDKELPGVIFSPSQKRLKRDGLSGLNGDDAVLWVVKGSTHNAHDHVKADCSSTGAIFERSRSDGISYVINRIKERILNRKN